MAAKSRDEEHTYGIGAVARLTGLTDHTIRVWERRYGAVVARRAENGRRQYDPADVEKLGLLKRLTDQGLSIGGIAGDSIDELRDRARSLSEIASRPAPERIDVAVLGDSLPARFADCDLSPIDVLIGNHNREAFVADIKRRSVDVVVLESPVLDGEVTAHLHDYMDQGRAARGVIVYSFGRSRDVDLARDAHVSVLRAPVNVDEVRDAIVQAYAVAPTKRAAPAAETPDADWDFSGPIAPRRFSNSELTTLAQASTAIDCECPQHLAQLVGDLTAFEIYSANCEDRDPADAALHRYLHRTTAQARALIEVALEKVAQAEGIEY